MSLALHSTACILSRNPRNMCHTIAFYVYVLKSETPTYKGASLSSAYEIHGICLCRYQFSKSRYIVCFSYLTFNVASTAKWQRCARTWRISILCSVWINFVVYIILEGWLIYSLLWISRDHKLFLRSKYYSLLLIRYCGKNLLLNSIINQINSLNKRRKSYSDELVTSSKQKKKKGKRKKRKNRKKERKK